MRLAIAAWETLSRRPESRDQRCRLRTATAPLLLAPTDNQAGTFGTALHQQRADTGRPADLVSADRHQIGAERIEIKSALAQGLNRIDEQNVRGETDHSRNRFERLNDPGLVVDRLHAHQGKARPPPGPPPALRSGPLHPHQARC